MSVPTCEEGVGVNISGMLDGEVERVVKGRKIWKFVVGVIE